jgi:hypothetical protein
LTRRAPATASGAVHGCCPARDAGTATVRPTRYLVVFDIATLWASLRAFGDAPTAVVIVVGYFVGDPRQRAPAAWAGIGGDRCVLGFGVDGGLAVVAVLAGLAAGQPSTADITA